MTGKELIMYILENNLIDVDIRDELFLRGFVSEAELAESMGVGLATVRAWAKEKHLDGFKINGKLYFLKIENKEEQND